MHASTDLRGQIPEPGFTGGDKFLEFPQVPTRTSRGDVGLPILYADASVFYSFFLADTARVLPLLPGEHLEPALTVGNRTLVALGCFDYRKSTVGVYHEVGLGIACRPRGQSGGWLNMATTIARPEARKTGLYVIDLPVTTDAACSAGREIWGLPKIVTGIDISAQGHTLDCAVRDPEGKSILRIQGQPGFGIPVQPLGLTLYSRLNGTLLRTHVDITGPSRAHLPGTMRLTLGDSHNPLRQHLDALGLEGKSPFAVVHAPAFRARLHGGITR